MLPLLKILMLQKFKKPLAVLRANTTLNFFSKKTGSDKINFHKEIFEAKFYPYKDFYIFTFKANSYLRSQIRLMVGFLLDISSGKRSIEELKEQLNKTKRSHFKPADGFGLYLAKVIY